MRILALETTDKTGTVAALDGSNLLAEMTLEPTRRSAQTLAPAIQSLLSQVGWRPPDVQLVGVSIGPGSFTGLRVGVTMAKVLAYAVGAEVLGVDTLEAVAAAAYGGPEEGKRGQAPYVRSTHRAVPANGACPLFPSQPGAAVGTLAVVADALRGDVIAQSFAGRPGGIVEPLGPQELIPAETWLARLAPGVRVAGPALMKLADRLPPGAGAMDRQYWFPQAVWVGRLTARHYALGRRDNVWRLAPRYFRRAAAEEKWEAMGK